MPPPRVKPVAPTVGVPESGARPCGAAAAMTSAQAAPGPKRAVRRSGSTVTWVSAEVLSRSPPSSGRTAPWPVDCTANGIPCSRAVRTAARTSAAPEAVATTAGRCSTARIQASRSLS